jgi:hypothetical protein
MPGIRVGLDLDGLAGEAENQVGALDRSEACSGLGPRKSWRCLSDFDNLAFEFAVIVQQAHQVSYR